MVLSNFGRNGTVRTLASYTPDVDPAGIFRNEWTDALLAGGRSASGQFVDREQSGSHGWPICQSD
jgi:hypothetical protein